jgi:hypothetical protein
MSSQAEIDQRNHRYAVRFFWALLIVAAMVGLIGNIAHAVLPYIPHVVLQVGAAAVPPLVLLAAVHGIALAVRAGASGWVYLCAVAAVAAIGLGAFALSFLALQDLMRAIGYSPKTAWVFPVIIDTTLAVCTLMLVALGDKPVRRFRGVAAPPSTQVKAGASAASARRPSPRTPQSVHVDEVAPSAGSAQVEPALLAAPAPKQHAGVAADIAAVAQAVVDAGATTKPVAVIESILSAHERGTAVNRIAADVGVHHKTVSRIIDAAEDLQRRQLVAV